MVLQFILPALVAFVVLLTASYIGTLRALDVYFDPTQDSYFTADEGPPRRGR